MNMLRLLFFALVLILLFHLRFGLNKVTFWRHLLVFGIYICNLENFIISLFVGLQISLGLNIRKRVKGSHFL